MSDKSGEEVEHDDDHFYLNVELSETDLEHLAHGSGVTFEFTDEDKGKTIAVSVDSEREVDKEWLLSSFEGGDESEAGLLARFVRWLA